MIPNIFFHSCLTILFVTAVAILYSFFHFLRIFVLTSTSLFSPCQHLSPHINLIFTSSLVRFIASVSFQHFTHRLSLPHFIIIIMSTLIPASLFTSLNFRLIFKTLTPSLHLLSPSSTSPIACFIHPIASSLSLSPRLPPAAPASPLRPRKPPSKISSRSFIG